MEAIKFKSFELNLTEEVINRIADLGYTPESLKEALKKHEQTNGSDSPALYCGTYGKYNLGNFSGMWVNVSTFDDYEDFENFCLAIHADEEYPELMFQDYEAFPKKWYNESRFDEDSFEAVREYSDLCDKYSTDAVDAFIDWGCEELEHFEDCYVGEYDSEEDFAREIVNECYDLENMMGDLANYFDYDAYARDLFMCDYYYDNGYVFRTF